MFNAPDYAAGKRAKCPTCGGVIEIPMHSPAEEIFEAEEEPVGPFGDDEFEVEPPSTLPAQDNRKPCPMCGESIQPDAVKCRYCGEIFDPILRAQEKKLHTSEDEDLSKLDWVLAIVCSGIGCIVGIMYLIQGKPKGKKMILIAICMQVVWGVVRAFIEAAARH
jgi:predicted RNA-binding Zn-ribbon protein involved in translation (DUF1610 family)